MSGIRIPIRLRAQVLARDTERCAYCRSSASLMGVTFEIDHMMSPRKKKAPTAIEAKPEGQTDG